MIFESTPLEGVHLIRPEAINDTRGFFARIYSEEEFAKRSLESRFVQANVSLSHRMGTLRGMHYQLGDAAEVKLVRCTHGEIFDVALDLRPDSPTFGKWFGTILSAGNHAMLYVPRGCAHGFVTLAGETEVFYFVSASYTPEKERVVRYDDARFAIAWPVAAQSISERDAAAREFDTVFHGIETLRGLL